MLEKQNKITVSELKAYLYSLEDKIKNIKQDEINKYKDKCKTYRKRVREREIQKIEKSIDKEYGTKLKTKDDILVLLDECAELPKDIEKIEVTQYMLYRINVRRAEAIAAKAIKRLGRIYNNIIDSIDKKVYDFPELDDIEEIDFSEFKTKEELLKKAKEEYKEEYTDEERNELIRKELEIIEKVKVFNSMPIPHEILKNSDRDIQSKMPKFNNVRQKRLKIIDSMEADYCRLLVPREINCMIDDAIENLDTVKEILTASEYKGIRNSLIKRRKKIYRNTNDIRNVIGAKEKKTGVLNYNIQEARYKRMETLRNIISNATSIIQANAIPGAEEQLEKLRISYEREKQYAAVIEKLEERSGTPANTEVKAYEEQITNLEKKINTSRRITKEKQEEITKAKKELLILWKMEMETTLSTKKEAEILELPEAEVKKQETVEEIKEEFENVKEPKKNTRKFFFKFKKTSGRKTRMCLK
ncbi:MAG: hypothetical protein HFJ54_05925 [Clostridia bacterium]|nr:hypothetical protein [Clostridia bacterium]